VVEVASKEARATQVRTTQAREAGEVKAATKAVMRQQVGG
jgi:hypothetical protein